MENPNKEIKILYTNWKNQTAVRRITPKEIVFIATEWHPEQQWCLNAYDLDKKADRTFACASIKRWY